MTRPQGFERALPLALAALVAGVVHAGLSPYEFRPENRVRRLAPGPGILFEGRGIASSEAPLRFGDPERPAGLSIELALRPLRSADADGGVAFSMYPVSLAQLMDIADAGQIMPPKSTWFEPKLRSGLVIHTF